MFALPDFGGILWPQVPLLETFVRGTITYLVLFAMLRVVLKRQSSTVGLTDLLVLVLIADAAQNSMAGDYRTIGDGLLLVATIIGWSWVLDWAGYRFPRIGRFVHPPPLPLVENGRIIRRNLRRELISHEELMTQLRLQGIEDLSLVRRAAMEGNGEISVVKVEGEPSPKQSKGGVR